MTAVTAGAPFAAATALPVDGADDVTVLAAPGPAIPDPDDVRLLSPAELARMGDLARDVDAAAFARGHALLRRLVAGWSGQDPAAVALLTEPGRAPRVPGTDLGCSIAHAGGLVLVAVARGRRVGVDVEAVDPSLSSAEMAWIEREVLRGSARDAADAVWHDGGDDGERRRFLRRWTRTEAVLKALGTGFAGDVDGGAASLTPPTWRVLDLDVGGGHVAALAIAPAALEVDAPARVAAGPSVSAGPSAARRAAPTRTPAG